MPLNERRIVEIILDEGQKLPERCKGYRNELINSIGDIIQAERQHKLQGTNIQQQVSDKVDALGHYLASQRGPGLGFGGGK